MGFNQYIKGKILSLSSCSTVNISELVSFLQSNPNITSLNLADCNISDEDVKELARLKSLTSLTLAGNKISNEGAKALANGSFINLTHLDLSDNRIGDEGVKELAKLTNLTYLDLSENIISDKGAKELVRLKKLTYLALLENDISDKVVEELLDKLINLTSFDLLDNDASYESEERQLVECATQTNEVDDLTSVASDVYSKGYIKNLEGESATVSDSKTSSNIGNTGKLNSNQVSMPVLKREQDSNKQLNDLNGNALHSIQKSRLPIITVSILTIAGVVLGIATAVYLEMQAVGIAVGTCCLVAAGIVYYCNKPARLLKDKNVREFPKDVQELVR
ncbi:MAG: leucine-rich repeat domain-containing protein [Rickettsiales bacterium]|jgi:Leucine-rich repeat (LRR) protein|nr:leucine-rich repeat domain-containing protein [Rickettsiales bacterium]